MTYDGQISLLCSQGLSVPDKKHAREVLRDIGYYELVNGYKALYKLPHSSQYREGASFDDLLSLYKFDENLRQLCFKYILRLEIRMRSLLSYAFCDTYSIRQNAYLDPDNYDNAPEKKRIVSRVIGELRSAARDDRSVYVAHQRKEYGNIPLWVLFKALSLGTVVRFYDAVKDDIRKKAADAFDDLYPATLGRMLHVMLDFRNACAHNNILYSCKSEENIPTVPCMKAAFGSARWDFAGNDLFALLVIFRCLLRDSDFRKCKDGFSNIIDHYLAQVTCVTREELLSVMGFPPAWENL